MSERPRRARLKRYEEFDERERYQWRRFVRALIKAKRGIERREKAEGEARQAEAGS